MQDQDFSERPFRRRLAGHVAQGDRGAVPSPRLQGRRTVRRWSNWSLAALIVGGATSTVALAHTIQSHTGSVAATPVTANAGTTANASAGTGTAAQAAPNVNTPVATTSASGVTTIVPANSAGGAASRVVTAQPSGSDS